MITQNYCARIKIQSSEQPTPILTTIRIVVNDDRVATTTTTTATTTMMMMMIWRKTTPQTKWPNCTCHSINWEGARVCKTKRHSWNSCKMYRHLPPPCLSSWPRIFPFSYPENNNNMNIVPFYLTDKDFFVKSYKIETKGDGIKRYRQIVERYCRTRFGRRGYTQAFRTPPKRDVVPMCIFLLGTYL